MKVAAVALLIGLLTMVSPLRAQLDEVTVARVFAVEAPPGYGITTSIPRWSPDGTLIAMNFDRIDQQNSPVERLWQIYDVSTGDLLHEHIFTDNNPYTCEARFVWYADGSRILMQEHVDTPFQIVDAQTGSVLTTLEDTGLVFATDPIEDVILTLDETHALRIYDADSGVVRFLRANVLGFPTYSPDETQFAITVEEVGVEIYDAANFTLLYTLARNRIGSESEGNWSPDGSQLIVVPFSSTHLNLGPRYIWTLGDRLSMPIYNLTSRIVWSSDQTHIVAAYDYVKVRIYDAHSGELMETIPDLGNGPIWNLSWNRQFLALKSGSHFNNSPLPTITVWDFQRNQIILRTEVDLASYTLDSGVIEINEPWLGIQRIDLVTGETVFSWEFDDPPYYFSPNGQWYLKDDTNFEVGMPLSIYVYETESSALVASLPGHTRIVNLYWGPDSHHFASVGEPNTIIVWDVIHTG